MTTYSRRWGLFLLGVTGLALAAMFADAARSGVSVPTTVPVTIPDRPRVPVVVPATVLVPAPPIDFALTLSLEPEDAPRRADSQFKAVSLLEDENDGGVEDTAKRGEGPLAKDAEAKDAEANRPPVVVKPRVRPRTSVEASAPRRPDAASVSGSSPSGGSRPVPASAGVQQRADTTGATSEQLGSSERQRLSQSRTPTPSPTPAVGLGGLIVDETMTPHGRTFYTAFYGVWQAPPVKGFYTIRVQEMPTAGRGTQVQVFVNDDVTFQGRLQRQTDIAEQALQAARRTYAYVRSGRGILKIY